MKTSLAILACSTLAGPAGATLVGVQFGSSPPHNPGSTGVHLRSPEPDPRLTEDVTSTPDFFGGDITFSSPMNVRQVGLGWATWSHGYTGSVFYSNGVTDVTVTFAPGTKVAQLYVEPYLFGLFEMTVTASDGESSLSYTQAVDGAGGAVGFAFYNREYIRDLVSVRITSTVDFGVGEFATAQVPAPAGAMVLSMAGIAARSRARRP